MRIFLLTLCLLAAASAHAAPPPLFGSVPSDLARASTNRHAGLRLATLSIAWSRFEPAENHFDPAYLAELQTKIAAFRAADQQIVLDVGIQYTPAWCYQLPHARFVNQYGDTFNQDDQPGMTGLNAVFNQTIRNKIAAYLSAVFQQLGTDFFAVRLGGGYYGELHYPNPDFNGHNDSFWAYDDIAQGKVAGLPQGIPPCNRTSDRAFIDWYLDALVNYQNWQIAAVRKRYPAPGRIFMMYPSWGTRPGTPGAIDKLVADHLKFTGNGEVHRGNDFARQIQAITDPFVAVYCTWADSDPSFGDDGSPDPAHWSPMHYLSFLAAQHPLRLECWAENTGHPNTLDEMRLTFQRVRDYKLAGLFWAFEPDLYANDAAHHATIQNYAQHIAKFQQ